MPALQATRQAEPPEHWLGLPGARGWLLQAQSAWPEGMADAAGGQAWLRLLPDASWPIPEPSARFACRSTLAPRHGRLDGAWRCDAARLPLPNAALSRIDVRFVLEALPDPPALLAECARALCEDGRLVVFGLNPFGLARLQWAGHGLRALSRRRVVALLMGMGLDVLDQRTLGPLWRPSPVDPAAAAQGAPRLVPGRVAWAVLATRRNAALTPLRRTAPAWRGTPGVPAA